VLVHVNVYADSAAPPEAGMPEPGMDIDIVLEYNVDREGIFYEEDRCSYLLTQEEWRAELTRYIERARAYDDFISDEDTDSEKA
jgi:hypothetical protein